MRKEDLISDILYLLMAGIVLLVGFLVIQPAMQSGLLGRETGQNIGFIIVALIIGVILNVLLMELGHILGAKIGGYKILSTNILGFNFYKEFKENDAKGHLKFRFKGFNGLTGETIIEPAKEKNNPIFFLLTPLILFLIEGLVMYFLIALAPEDSNGYFAPIQVFKYGLIVSTTIAGCMALYDYFPAKLDTLNDGYRLVSLKNKINIEAFNEQLKIQANEFKGNKEFSYKVFEEITDFTARVNLFTAQMLMKEDKFEEALKIIESCLLKTEKVTTNTKRELILNKIVCVYLTEGNEAGTKLYKELDEETKDIVKRCKTIDAIKVYALYIGLDEKSKSEVKYALNRLKKFYDHLSNGEIEREMTLAVKITKKLIDAEPSLVDDESLKDVCYNKTELDCYKELNNYKLSKLKSSEENSKPKEEPNKENE